jgi:cobalamin 5'-phosphate synthase/cobalamin synthase
MTDIFKGFSLAISMLTTLPFFRVHDFYKGINGYAVMFYPLVGFLLGSILWGVFVLLENSLPLIHLGIIIFAFLVLLTGAIHLDGFSDTIDGLYVKKEKALQVMKDPNVGAMGMISTAVFLILKASSIVVLLETNLVYLLPIVLMLSRFNAVLAIYFYPYINKNGMGSLAKEELKLFQVVIAFIYVAVLSVIFLDFYIVIISILTLLFLAWLFVKRYGGFSGDIYGFSIEVSEVVLLNYLILVMI